jgi:hypothetical protein
MVETIFTGELFTQIILPWAFVFVLFFAILEKTELLGEGKRQINALISAIIALILLAFPGSRDIIVELIPVLVVAAVILFVFLLLYAFIHGKEKDMFGKGIKVSLGIAVGIAVAVSVLVIAGVWDSIWDYLTSADSLATSIIFALIVIGVVVAVLYGSKTSSSKE